MTEEEKKSFVLSAVSELKSVSNTRRSKYERNLQLYEATMNISLDSFRSGNTVGYWNRSGHGYNTTPDMNINVIKSCVDTLTSKVASVKVRPFVNTVNGSFKDVMVAKQTQAFFDQWFNKQGLNKEVANAFRDSAVFEVGILYAQPSSKKIIRCLPWQVYYRPSELTYNKKPTRIYYERKEYPTSLIPNYKGTESYIAYGEYYDTVNHIYAELFSTGEVIIHPFNSCDVPFVIMHYNNPILGNSSNSIVDMLIGIQLEIDELINTVKEASQLNPANTIFAPKGSGIEMRKFTNGVGQLIEYTASPNMTTSPITVATPPFIDAGYMKLFEDLKQTAYEMVGISQLSATSQKPQGLDSGVALQTMENIESDRFETQMDAVVRAYVDLCRICIHCFDPNEDILPEQAFKSPVTWKDIVDLDNRLLIQFSGADQMSKDPSVKLQQLQMMAQSGIIPAQDIARYMELPDIENGYNYVNNQWNAVQMVIWRCLDNDVYEVPPFVTYSLLEQEILNTQLSLFSSDPEGNTVSISKLNRLFKMVYDTSNNMQQFQIEQQQQIQEEAELAEQDMEEGMWEEAQGEIQ